jgi:hypothetical protein
MFKLDWLNWPEDCIMTIQDADSELAQQWERMPGSILQPVTYQCLRRGNKAMYV